MDTFANLLTGITNCPKCYAEVFFDENKNASHVDHICWSCNSIIRMPVTLVVEKNKVLLNNDAKIYAHHIYDNYDMETVVGSIVQNPKSPNIWGIKNESKDTWTYIKPDGIQTTIPIGRSATIARDIKINFGLVIGEFQ